MDALHNITWNIMYSNPDSANKIALKQLNHAQQKGLQYWEADALKTIGNYYSIVGEPQKALEKYFLSLDIFKQLNNTSGIASVFSSIGYAYSDLSNYPQSLDFFFKAAKINEFNNNINKNAGIYIGIANVYVQLEDYNKALNFYNKAMKIGEISNNKDVQGVCLANIGSVYNKTGNQALAIEYFSKSLALNKKSGNKKSEATNIYNIGEAYFNNGEFETSLSYFIESAKVREELRDINGLTANYLYIGLIFTKTNKYKDAEKYLQKSLELANDIGDLERINETHFYLSELYNIVGKSALSLEHYKQYIVYRDSVHNSENIKKLAYTEIQYEFDKKEMIAKAEQEKKDAVALKEKQQQQVIVYITSGGLLIFLLLAVFIYKGYSQKKKLSLNLAYKNQEITDSINYAKRIQEAILPTEDEFKTAFPDSFILFKPKDIVSGDFYWIGTNPKEFPSIDKERVSNGWRVKNPLVAAVDCTGHGVPGSLMSMMGNSLLNKIVDTHKISSPNEILNLLRTEIINSLKQHGEKENKDGMDIALCTVYDDRIEYAGANNPIYVIRKNGNLEEIKADKMPVGYSGIQLKPYTNHSVKMERGDSFYIFTDGYADQFGGKDNKKFKYKQFKDLLVTINSKSMQSQKEILNETIENWKGTNEQTDDILVIGIRI
ncbi:MAG: tetratricopeptide repeat protein [Bacteroidetes bacterium]|nr:tetratricopeptide repeat protein [Bacteroidota bacterium]